MARLMVEVILYLLGILNAAPRTWRSHSAVGQLCFKGERKKEGGRGRIICVYSKNVLLHTHTHELDLVLALTQILLVYNLTYLRIS